MTRDGAAVCGGCDTQLPLTAGTPAREQIWDAGWATFSLTDLDHLRCPDCYENIPYAPPELWTDLATRTVHLPGDGPHTTGSAP